MSDGWEEWSDDIDDWWDRSSKRLKQWFSRLWKRSGEGSSYVWVRFLFLRVLGLTYVAAFASLVFQLPQLLGSNGLTPIQDAVAAASGQVGFVDLPSMFWFVSSDWFLMSVAVVGLVLAVALLFGYANVPSMVYLWFSYMSFVNLGQVWYGYGWETQLLETGFLAIFLVPLWDPRPFSDEAPSPIGIWLLRWLAFRIYLGAGLIKIRGDQCWSELTCLTTHFETQPIPNPVSPYLHALPDWFHTIGTAFNHVVELAVPFTLFMGGFLRGIGGLVLIAFQVMLIISGNLSFLNYLTIAAAISYLDDDFLRRITPDGWFTKKQVAPAGTGRKVASIILAVVVAVFSVPVVGNLISDRQRMNASFDTLHLVNTYGAFGSVTETRHELIVEGTTDPTLGEGTVWKEYEFYAKPGDVGESLPVVAPYQPRLSWQLWFAAMSSPDREPWLLHLVWKLLHADESALELVKEDPFNGQAPEYIRIQFYEYEFAPLGSDRTWNRSLEGTWLAPVSTDNPRGQQIRQYIQQRWGR